MRKYRKVVLAGLLALPVCIWVALQWFLSRPVGPDVIAERCLQAALAGNAGELLRYEHKHELELVKWDRVRLKAILDYTNGTILRGVKPRGLPVRQFYGEHQGVAFVQFKEGKYSADLSMSAERADDGPRTCISAYVLSAMSVRTKLDGRSGVGTDWRVHRAAMSDTMAKYMGRLNELGLSGFVSQDPTDPHLTRWETWVKYKGGAAMTFSNEKVKL